MNIKTYGVIGAGQMGNGIAQVASASGLNVIMNDIKPEFVERGLATITKNLDRSVKKGKLSEMDRDAVLGRIRTSTDPGNHSFHQPLVHPHRTDRRKDKSPGKGHRHAFHESGAGDEAGGGYPGHCNIG